MTAADTDAINAAPDADLACRFTYHPPKDDQPRRYRLLRDETFLLACKFKRHCPPSRELSIALTHLETAIMFANAAIARHE